MAISLYVREIEDSFLRENFRKLKDFFGIQPILNGDFTYYTFSITGNVSFKFAHNLSFVPKDVIQTSAIFSGGAGSVAWNYSSFDATFIYLTTTGMGTTDTCTIRAIVGRF